MPRGDGLVWNGKTIDLRWSALPDPNLCIDLWRAVVVSAAMDAIAEVKPYETKHRDEKSKWCIDKNSKKNAIDWIMSDEKERFNSFRNLCELCGIRYDKIRNKIRTALKAEGGK